MALSKQTVNPKHHSKEKRENAGDIASLGLIEN